MVSSNCAAGVTGSTASFQGASAGSYPSAALHNLKVTPIPLITAKKLIVSRHYLHSMPGGTKLSFGVFLKYRLMGVLTLGVGPANGHCLIDRATADDCLTLTRLWLSDELPANSESRIIGVVLRSLRKHTNLKFLLSYSDPAQGHLGTIYQATGWLYTGLSVVMPLYDLGDGVARHSRSVAQVFGSHSKEHFIQNGIAVKLLPQTAKHRYIYFLESAWRSRLTVTILPYPKKEEIFGNCESSPGQT
jgi:hypothetical protein